MQADGQAVNQVIQPLAGYYHQTSLAQSNPQATKFNTKIRARSEPTAEPISNVDARIANQVQQLPAKVASLVRQPVERKQMMAVWDKEGRMCTGTNGVGRALGVFPEDNMASPPKDTRECTAYPEECDPLGYS